MSGENPSGTFFALWSEPMTEAMIRDRPPASHGPHGKVDTIGLIIMGRRRSPESKAE